MSKPVNYAGTVMSACTSEHYLGDGLYVRRDAYGTVWLRAPREEGDHFVGLEPEVLAEFERWLHPPRPAITKATKGQSEPFEDAP